MVRRARRRPELGDRRLGESARRNVHDERLHQLHHRIRYHLLPSPSGDAADIYHRAARLDPPRGVHGASGRLPLPPVRGLRVLHDSAVGADDHVSRQYSAPVAEADNAGC